MTVNILLFLSYGFEKELQNKYDLLLNDNEDIDAWYYFKTFCAYKNWEKALGNYIFFKTVTIKNQQKQLFPRIISLNQF